MRIMCGHNKKPAVPHVRVVMRNLMCGFINVQAKQSNCLDDGFGSLINSNQIREEEMIRKEKLQEKVDENGKIIFWVVFLAGYP